MTNDEKPVAAAAPAAKQSAEARILELQAKEDERQAKRKTDRAGKQLERLELIERYEEQLGPRGREFVIVSLLNVGEGFIVLSRPKASAHKRFMVAYEKAKAKGASMEEGDVHQYVRPSVVHPTLEEFGRIATERPGIPITCAGEMMKMITADEEADSEK